MESLVGYGLSSGSESDEDGDPLHDGTDSSTGESLKAAATVVTKTRNFLLESSSASSESDGESEPDRKDETWRATTVSSLRQQHRPPPPPRSSLPSPNRLPPPPLGVCGSGSGVFSNPFKAQADHKLSVLQKHVPLTMQAKPALIGGKRVCVAYRKDGRCRFGIKCKYAHDSDLQNPVSAGFPASADPGPETADPSPGESRVRDDKGPPGKKKRVGLSNTLMPPKRALKQYALQKERDRAKPS
ncbi:hypothetical protein NHX12_017548 [Muraenolepis orangiensis]|uniref:C3H1-type domain-containing protein n=1 Tax=Muraenolepis orangiensis TaxID=630683 RepID=A0A9Q0EY38_9TELE|nr:hypothetical protein NHX12_017548 [Muraenolepis orangiensis]